MPKPLKKIVVTGAAGQIAYNLLFRIAAGEVLGSDQPIALHLLELPEAIQALEGVKMELEDCAFPLLESIQIGSDPFKLFQDIDIALLIGSKPRGPGMERKDLLNENGKIFIEQGQALNEGARKDAKVFVIGNPCNTNCLIAMSHAPRLAKENFQAMTRLDQNRAQFQLAEEAGLKIDEISNVIIWGNHSSTQVPDFFNARANEKPVTDCIKDMNWLENTFIPLVQKRGAAIINARGKSSAGSAAQAIIDSVRDTLVPTAPERWFSSAVDSTHNSYGIQDGLIFSFPCRINAEGKREIVENVPLNEFLLARLKLTEQELIEERDLIKGLIKN